MKNRLTRNQTIVLSLLAGAAMPASLLAQSTTFSQVVQADTYVSSDSPNSNFGSLGAMEIASPTAAQARTQESLIRFNTATMFSTFNTDYGAGNWAVTGVTLKLFSNFATAGVQPNNTGFNVIEPGQFELDWLSNDSWSETGITWNTIGSVLPGAGNNTLASLGDFMWPATGAASTTWTLNLDPNLVNDIDSGGLISIFGQPTAGSTVGYLFNTLNNAPAILNVTVAAVPEPGTIALVASGLAGLAALRRRKA